MRTFIGGTLGTALIALLLFPAPASASPSEHLNWGQELTSSDTSCPKGERLINVMQRVVDDLDSGFGSNSHGYPWWATSEYVRQITVVKTADNGTEPDEFCAKVKYQGSFDSVAGDSPGCNDGGDGTCDDNNAEDTIGDNVTGTFQGGYTATFSGTFTPGSTRTKGNIGTTDYECQPNAPRSGCTGYVDWTALYFNNDADEAGVDNFTFTWWGWVYHAGKNGSWVNAADGSTGDITGY